MPDLSVAGLVMLTILKVHNLNQLSPFTAPPNNQWVDTQFFIIVFLQRLDFYYSAKNDSRQWSASFAPPKLPSPDNIC